MNAKIILALAALFTCLAIAPTQAQSQTEANFAERLKTVSAATETIECDFTLTGTMSFMTGDVVSKGRFYYLRGVGISLVFSDPAGDEITMGREKFRITTGGKTNVVKLDSNPMLGQLKRMLTACMTGDIAALKAGSALAFEDTGDGYIVTLTPDNRRAKGMVKLITLTFEKEQMSLVAMRMDQASGDVTVYSFSNKKFNQGVDAARFEVR